MKKNILFNLFLLFVYGAAHSSAYLSIPIPKESKGQNVSHLISDHEQRLEEIAIEKAQITEQLDKMREENPLRYLFNPKYRELVGLSNGLCDQLYELQKTQSILKRASHKTYEKIYAALEQEVEEQQRSEQMMRQLTLEKTQIGKILMGE